MAKKRVLGVGAPQSLIDAEGSVFLDRLPSLIDFLLRKLRDELEVGFNLLNELRLENFSIVPTAWYLIIGAVEKPFLGRHQSALEG